MRRWNAKAVARVLALIGISLGLLAGPSLGQVAGPSPSGVRIVADNGTITSEGFGLRYRIEGTGRSAIVIGSAVYYPRVFSRIIPDDQVCIARVRSPVRPSDTATTFVVPMRRRRVPPRAP
ncbi:MAG: hypothetical protein ACLQGP_24515 [Isosphaeraceae bacterium]